MAKMNGIDISKWQGKAGFNPQKVPADFIIIRATYGLRVVDQYMRYFANVAISLNKPIGFYHFATGEGGGVAEAKAFLAQVKPYVGKALLILDWEAGTLAKGPGYAKDFCDYVYKETGVIPILYTNTFVPNSYNWKEFLAAGYKYLWGAEYNKNQEQRGYNPHPDNKHLPTNGFTEIIRQYSSNTYLPGYSGRLDVNEAYIDRYEWQNLCKKVAVQQEPKPTLTNEQIALKIIDKQDGWAGVNGNARKVKLESLGYNYREVQDTINRIIEERKRGEEYYTVVSGDSLSKISSKYKISLNDLLKLNPDITNPRIIKVGQRIRIK
ncbi:MAG: LysM peptidoglycan-binding domain-containing protein [Acholeplasmatales bacterium]|nr:LysM peptidoglycan-binding domain-containing protein [Acholeplasmatales bacterium]